MTKLEKISSGLFAVLIGGVVGIAIAVFVAVIAAIPTFFLWN